MARKLTGGLVGQPSVGAINVAPTAVITAAENQNITLSPGGIASVVVTNDLILNDQKDLRFGDSDSSNYVAFQAPSTVAADVTWTLPNADGSSGNALTTNGSGTLSWAAPALALSDNTSDSGTNYLTFTTSTSGSLAAARVASTKLTFQPSTGTVDVGGIVRSLRTENVQTGSYTLALTDRNLVVTMNNTGSATVTIPLDAATNFPIGSVVYIARVNTGAVTLAATAGVTVSKTGTFGPNEEIAVRKRSANNWIVIDAERNLSGTGGTTSTPTGFSLHQFTSTGSSTFTVS